MGGWRIYYYFLFKILIINILGSHQGVSKKYVDVTQIMNLRAGVTPKRHCVPPISTSIVDTQCPVYDCGYNGHKKTPATQQGVLE